MKSPNLDSAVFFAENSDEFLKDAGISLEDVVETVIQVTTVAGTTVHTVPLRSAIEQLKASQEYVREDCSAAGLPTTDVRNLEKLQLQLMEREAFWMQPTADTELNGTFKDWRNSNKGRAKKIRQRVDRVLQEKQERQKCDASLVETEALTIREFSECGLPFDWLKDSAHFIKLVMLDAD
jgi:hypothetical protein